MTKILIINTVSRGSTGKICKDLYKLIENSGNNCCIAYGRGSISKEIECNYKIANDFDLLSHIVKTRFTDGHGLGSYTTTKKLLKFIDSYNPDIIHLHNLHGYYINIKLLFNYLKTHSGIKVIWTLHDCWAFTGHCTHFTYKCNCEKWKFKCSNCPQINEYPKSFIDRSEKNYEYKKNIFNLSNMIITTPSKWLANIVKCSFLGKYPINVIANGIDTSVFHYRESSFREKYNIKNKKIILGVSDGWSERKGLNDFEQLNELLDDSYQIILVGGTKKEFSRISNNIICIEKTENQVELAEIYSAADIYFNPSYQETFGLVTVEAICCGTPVLVFDNTAIPEVVNQTNGVVLKQRDSVIVFETIKKMIENKYEREIVARSGHIYESNKSLSKFLDLYGLV